MEDIRFNGELNFSVSNVGFVSVVRNENFVFEYKNGKDLHSFVYVDSGELEYCFYNTKEKMKIKKGSLLFIPKQLPYKTKYLKNSTKIKLIIFDLAGKVTPFETVRPFSKTASEISEFFSSFNIYNSGNTLLLYSKLYELFHFIQTENPEIVKKYKKILPAVTAMTEYYFENRKISYYADMCGMSESNFRKLFKEYKGISPIEYRNIIRCRQVKKMLDSMEFSVSEAAYLTGFNNMSFFYEVYNKYKHL